MPADTVLPETTEAPAVAPAEPGHAGPWIVILYNDDWHSIDQVVRQLQKGTACSVETAVAITLTAHHRGRAIAFEGALEVCERAAGVLREIRLQAEIDRNY